MVETSFPWSGTSPGSAGAYSDDTFADVLRKLMVGILSAKNDASILIGSGDGTNTPLDVQESSPQALSVNITKGSALVYGRFYDNSTTESLPINQNTDGSGYDRIDSIVLEVNFSDQTILLAVVEGTPAASPVAPTLQKDAAIWQALLANVTVTNLDTVIQNADIDNTVKVAAIIRTLLEGGTGVSSQLNAGSLLIKGITNDILEELPLGVPNEWHGIVGDPAAGGPPYYVSLPIMPAILQRNGNVAFTTSYVDVAINSAYMANYLSVSTPLFTPPAGNWLGLVQHSDSSIGSTLASITYRIYNNTAASPAATSVVNGYADGARPEYSFVSEPLTFAANGTDAYKLQVVGDQAVSTTVIRPRLILYRTS